MSVDVRSLGGEVPTAFDFDSQAGILFVLKAIRLSDASPAEKNKLKDLVFIYNTGGKDPAVKEHIEAQLSDNKISPETVAHAQAVDEATRGGAKMAPVAGYSAGRLVPSFGGVTAAVAAPVVAQPLSPFVPSTRGAFPVQNNNQSSVSPVPIRLVDVIPPSVVKPVVRTENVVPIIKEIPVTSKQAVPAVEMTEAPNIELKAKDTTEPLSINRPEPLAPVSVDQLQKNAEVRMERIRTIKAAVNDRVGNPVNLVDVDNTLGREYMSALLEAMKLLSSAGEAEAEKAMSRLETVFTHVIKLLDDVQSKVEAPTIPVVEVVTPVSQMTAPTTVPVPVQPVEVIEPVRPVVALPTDFSIRSKVTDKPAVDSVGSGWDSLAETSVPVEKLVSVAEAVTVPNEPADIRFSTPPALPIQTHVVVPVPNLAPESVRSVVEEAPPLRSISELKTADEVSAIEAMGNNPLYTKDVDAGLEQLLGEWSIFKKSGLFGTGPKGREHPLYVKLSTLQVPLILSGRFEGSNQEIKQSVTDYMNGWRYEQGIIYEANETLDEYLRRVIRHIIDLQKTKRRS